MNFELMARTTRYYKETPEGVSYMCKVMEERIKENVEIAEYNYSLKTAERMLAKGTYTLEEIAEVTALPLEEVQQLADEQNSKN